MLAARFDDFKVHVVEVCRTCSWNHLVKSYVLGTAQLRRNAALGLRARERARRVNSEGRHSRSAAMLRGSRRLTAWGDPSLDSLGAAVQVRAGPVPRRRQQHHGHPQPNRPRSHRPTTRRTMVLPPVPAALSTVPTATPSRS